MNNQNVSTQEKSYGLRPGAEEFPLMVILSIIYPCNMGCPNCPYTDGNSEIRQFYRKKNADLMPVELWNKIADEAGPYEAWLRCTGGGEPLLHPHMIEMIEYAKLKGARVWLNTNGSMFGPTEKLRNKLERVVRAGIDLIEFSMDAADPQTYAVLRPPRSGKTQNPEIWWSKHVDNIRAALAFRKQYVASTRIVVSMIRQEAIEGTLDKAVKFWLDDIGVDEVITRKFLSWDDNTSIDLNKSLDPHLYGNLSPQKDEPCVWPFERLNVDTLGRIALCGQDISFKTAELFPTVWDSSIRDIWQGERFNWYRRMHLEGRGAECWPCRGCSAWFAGIRDWEHGWQKVLLKSGDHMKEMMKKDLGVEVEIYQPKT